MSQLRHRRGAIGRSALRAPASRKTATLPPNDDCPPHARDAAVSAHQGAASRCASLLPHGRFLRAVLRRCRRGRPPAGHHPHGARAFGWQAHSDGRRAVPCGGRLPCQAGGEGPRRGHLRADRRSGHRQRAGGAARGADRHARHAGGRRSPCAGSGQRIGRRQAGGRRLGLRVAEPLLRRFRRRRGEERRRAGGEPCPSAASGSALAGRCALHRRAGAAARRDGVRRRAGFPAPDGAFRHRLVGSLRDRTWRQRYRRCIRRAALRPSRPLPGLGVRRPAGEDVECGRGGHGRTHAPQSGNRPPLRRQHGRHVVRRDEPHRHADGRSPIA